MTNMAGDEQVTFTMNYRDAEQYSTWARRPAVPAVRDAIRQACRDYRPGTHDRVIVNISREQAETFLRKSTRPWRLHSGATVKGLIQLALDDAATQPAQDAAEDAELDEQAVAPDEVMEQPLDVHSEEPDQEPSPVSDESEDELPEVDVRAATEAEHEAALPNESTVVQTVDEPVSHLDGEGPPAE